MAPTSGAPSERADCGEATLAWLPLALALSITLVVMVYPHALASPTGGADHWAATAAFWAMSAGYVREVGFVPRHAALRAALSTWACLVGTILAVLRLSLA